MPLLPLINSSGNTFKPAARWGCYTRSPIPIARSLLHVSGFHGNHLDLEQCFAAASVSSEEPEGTSGRVNRNILPFLLRWRRSTRLRVVPTQYNRELLPWLPARFCGYESGDTTNHDPPRRLGPDQHYSLGVQQQLTPKTIFEIAYVGNHGVHLQSTDDFNDPVSRCGSSSGPRRPFQPWGTITFQSQDLGTTYQSLQSKISSTAREMDSPD